MRRLLKLPPFMIFCIIGLINTLIDIGLYLALQEQGLPLIAANTVSTSIALGVSFVLNKRFTFNAQLPGRQALGPFIAVTLTGLWVLQPLIIYLALSAFHIPAVNDALAALYGNFSNVEALVAKLIATPATIIWNFTLYRRFVFIIKRARKTT